MDDLIVLIRKRIISIRVFVADNKGFIDLLFLCIYALLQLALLILQYLRADFALVLPIFILTFLTVMSIEKICMTSRYNYLDKQMTNMRILSQKILAREQRVITISRKDGKINKVNDAYDHKRGIKYE
jgi:uncharacterized membrane protein